MMKKQISAIMTRGLGLLLAAVLLLTTDKSRD